MKIPEKINLIINLKQPRSNNLKNILVICQTIQQKPLKLVKQRNQKNKKKQVNWICHKFGIGESKDLVKNFEEETHSFIDPQKQLEHEEREKEWELELQQLTLNIRISYY